MTTTIDSLKSEFDAQMKLYSDTYQQYMETINSSPNEFDSVPNASYSNLLGTLSSTPLGSIDECKSLCASTAQCSGATFMSGTCTTNVINSTEPTTGSILPTPKSTAIVKRAMAIGYKLKSINDHLLSLNREMDTQGKKELDAYQSSKQQVQKHALIINDNRQLLLTEKAKIEGLIKSNVTLSQAYENSELMVNANYYWYLIWLVIAILMGVAFIRMSALFTASNQPIIPSFSSNNAFGI
jgi:hypothetical protein